MERILQVGLIENTKSVVPIYLENIGTVIMINLIIMIN
jgi:hypothetical protein